MLFPHVSYLVWIRTILPCSWRIRYKSNSFTNFLGLLASFMFEVLIYSVVHLSGQFQRERHCFYWTRTLIAICSTMWNILYHTVLPYCRELMVPQSCPPPAALALRWCSGHARCQWYVLLHEYDFPSCTFTASSAVGYSSGSFDNSATFMSLYLLCHKQSQSGTNSRRTWVSLWWCAVILKFIPLIGTLPHADSFRLFIPYNTSYGIVIGLRAARPCFEKINCFGIKSK